MAKCDMLTPSQDTARWRAIKTGNGMTGTTVTGMKGAATEIAILRVGDSLLMTETSQTTATIRNQTLGAPMANIPHMLPRITRHPRISRLSIQLSGNNSRVAERELDRLSHAESAKMASRPPDLLATGPRW